ncbi:hypothetical protein F5B19DRAFT_474093 [Rostrohypoxylon terebratum]|nr:hypothetical protein F5B19DRAFT_474093 [Rostrohypoxylon terebratum]
MPFLRLHGRGRSALMRALLALHQCISGQDASFNKATLRLYNVSIFPHLTTTPFCSISRGQTLPIAKTMSAIQPTPAATRKAIEGKGAWTIRSEQIGLKILVQPDNPDVDIIAIHGMGAKPENTWNDRESKVNWLTHATMLPAALPQARIMTYNYASHWFGEHAIKQSLSGVSIKLLNSLVDGRGDCPNRPILLIGHCFGGLVAQEVYNRARMHHQDYPSIADSIVGMIFLGTPHHGIPDNCSFGTQGQIYKAVMEANVHVECGLIETIAQDNEILVNTVHNFTRIVELRREDAPKLCCFYEQKASRVGRLVGLDSHPLEFVVGQMSGTLDGHGKEPLPLDHFQMNKFQGSNDDNYRSVLREILKMIKSRKIPQYREESTVNSPKSRTVWKMRHRQS